MSNKTRISIDLEKDDHVFLKTTAASFDKTLKDFIMDRLPEKKHHIEKERLDNSYEKIIAHFGSVFTNLKDK